MLFANVNAKNRRDEKEKNCMFAVWLCHKWIGHRWEMCAVWRHMSAVTHTHTAHTDTSKVRVWIHLIFPTLTCAKWAVSAYILHSMQCAVMCGAYRGSVNRMTRSATISSSLSSTAMVVVLYNLNGTATVHMQTTWPNSIHKTKRYNFVLCAIWMDSHQAASVFFYGRLLICVVLLFSEARSSCFFYIIWKLFNLAYRHSIVPNVNSASI